MNIGLVFGIGILIFVGFVVTWKLWYTKKKSK